jgi:prenyltransferase beta subunit
LPGIGGSPHAEAHIAFYFAAMYVLQILKLLVADRSAEDAALALGTLDAEIEDFMSAHAVAVQ